MSKISPSESHATGKDRYTMRRAQRKEKKPSQGAAHKTLASLGLLAISGKPTKHGYSLSLPRFQIVVSPQLPPVVELLRRASSPSTA